MTLFYTPTDPPPRPFAVGDEVETLDRDHNVMETVKVTRVTSRRVYTSCGRRWSLDGLWHDGNRAYPFPSIRLVRSDDQEDRRRDEIEEGMRDQLRDFYP